MTKTLVEQLREAKHLHLETKMLLETAASRIEELEKAMEGLVDDLERRHRQVAEVCDEMQQQANDGYSYHRLVGKQAAYHHAAELAYQALSYKG
jgi:RNA binding exosome subunit